MLKEATQKDICLSLLCFVLADRLYGRASADDVVQSVRRLRAERDQLRLRDRDHSRSMRQVRHHFIGDSHQEKGLHLRGGGGGGVGEGYCLPVALCRVKCCSTLLSLTLLCIVVLSSTTLKGVSRW